MLALNPKIERRFYRGRKDEAIPMMAAVVGLILASGTTPLAYADDGKQRVTIFTPGLSGDRFVCSAVNVSEKALGITFALFDTNGALLDGLEGSAENPSSHFGVPPGTEAEIESTFKSGIPPTDGYCKVVVSGTHDRNDVRVDLLVYWTKPIIPGTTTPIIQLARTVQGF